MSPPRWSPPGVAEYLPALHATQVDAVIAPGVAEYLPATHATQVDSVLAPGVAEYLPALESRLIPHDRLKRSRKTGSGRP
ncbi:MAG: hypothetical protein ACK55Z_20605, partial [bacterium]